MKFLNQAESAKVDEEFFNTLGYTLDQLMELAGLSVAQVAFKEFPPSTHPAALVICGPGSLHLITNTPQTNAHNLSHINVNRQRR